LKNRFLIVTVFFIAIAFLTSCKSAKGLASGEPNLNLSLKQLIRENERRSPNFKTLQAKLKITYSHDGDEQSHSVNFRMKKGEVIWINSAFSVIRAMITPERVSFYNKLDNTYLDGDYNYLSNLLGIDLDYKKVENLLLGEALFGLKDDTYNVSIIDDAYVLQPKEQKALMELFYILSPTHFKVKSQQISQPKERRFLQVDYLNYQEVEKQALPENIKIIALESNKEMIAELEFKSVSLNEDLRFPFSIPSGFDEIKL